MFDASNRALRARLDDLAGLETVSPFSVAFYGLVLHLLDSLSREEAGRLVCAGLLDVELRYHRELKRLAEAEAVTFEDLRAAGEKHRIGLESVQEFAGRAAQGQGLGVVASHLVMAECCYHLRRTEQVVTSLERAAQLGVDEPLLHFALGYNRYVLALETCTEQGETEGDMVVRDPLSFQVQCLRAVGAFEDGLTGGELDAQLYWWIGTVLEAAGLTDAAQDAYDKSAALFAEGQANAEEHSVAPPGTFGPGAAITEEEVRRAGELLKGTFAPSEILGTSSEDGS
jgi:hypothetical protein